MFEFLKYIQPLYYYRLVSKMPHAVLLSRAELDAITTLNIGNYKNQDAATMDLAYQALQAGYFPKGDRDGIQNVVIGTVDPNLKVAGKGIKKLIESGANVTVGVLEKECNELNKRFFTFHEKKRPYIILKWAESQDGFIAPLTLRRTQNDEKNRKPVWITNEFSRQLVHKWRSEEQAILVGTNTVIEDNPKLDVRDWKGNNPIRIVLDQNNRIPKESHIFNNQAKTIVFSKSTASFRKEIGIFETIDFRKNIAQQIVQILYKHQIQSIIIEGELCRLL